MKSKFMIIKILLLNLFLLSAPLLYSLEDPSNNVISDITLSNESGKDNIINHPRSREQEATDRKLLEGYILNNYHVSSSNNMAIMRELSEGRDKSFREGLYLKYKKSSGLWRGTLNFLVPPIGMLGLGSLFQGDYNGVVIECVFTFGSITTSTLLFLGGNSTPSAVVLFIGLSLGYVSSWFIPILYETGYNDGLKKGLNLMEAAPPVKNSVSYYNMNSDSLAGEMIHIPLLTFRF